MLRLVWALARASGAWLRRLPREAAVALGAEGLDQPRRPTRLWQTILVIIPLSLLGYRLIGGLTLVMTPSIDAWGVRPDSGPIVQGDLVTFTLSHPLAGPNPVSVTKYVLCMPGHELSVIEKASIHGDEEGDGWYYCDGEFLGISKPFGTNGQRLDHLRWSGVIPPGEAYVGSSHPSGLDSRYFGLVRLDRLTRMKRVF
jgi:conjugal transfer pilin signal peptidase TrbI